MLRFWVLREINSRFCSKTQWQMFLLVSGRHVGAHLGGHQHGGSIQISITCDLNLGESICISTFFVFPDCGRNLFTRFWFFILIYFEWRDTENQQLSYKMEIERKLKIKIGPQCVLGVLCLNLFLSDGMLFSNISIWELNYYKWKVRQVITTYKWKRYGRILLTCFISNNNWRLSCK